jgi:hypothetical protein
MLEFNIIHIFKSGEVQIVGDISEKLKAQDLISLDLFIKSIKDKKPVDCLESDFHAIHILNGIEIRYLAQGNKITNREKKSFSIKWHEIDHSALYLFIKELDTQLESISHLDN